MVEDYFYVEGTLDAWAFLKRDRVNEINQKWDVSFTDFEKACSYNTVKYKELMGLYETH